MDNFSDVEDSVLPNCIDAGSWPAILDTIRRRDFFMFLDEILHIFDGWAVLDWLLWETGDWRINYCQWSALRGMDYEDSEDVPIGDQNNLQS